MDNGKIIKYIFIKILQMKYRYKLKKKLYLFVVLNHYKKYINYKINVNNINI